MKTRKISSILLSVVIAVSMLMCSVTAYAEENSYTGALAGRDDIIEVVKGQIKDPIIAKAVLDYLDESGTANDASWNWETAKAEMTELNLPYTEDMDHKIQDLSGVQWLTGLKTVNLSGHAIEDITVLGSLGLEELDLSNNLIQVIAPLSADNIKGTLKELNLSGNLIEETGPLNYVTGLESLDLSDNEIRDLGGIDKLENLTSLNVSKNNIEDLGSLVGMTKLETLDVSNNSIEDLYPIKNLAALESLDISDNKVEDLNPIAGLTNLKDLDVTNNAIEDFSMVPEGVAVTGKDEQEPNEHEPEPDPTPAPVEPTKKPAYRDTVTIEIGGGKTESESKSEENPNTGAPVFTGEAAVLGVVSFAGVAIAKKKEGENKKKAPGRALFCMERFSDKFLRFFSGPEDDCCCDNVFVTDFIRFKADKAENDIHYYSVAKDGDHHSDPDGRAEEAAQN